LKNLCHRDTEAQRREGKEAERKPFTAETQRAQRKAKDLAQRTQRKAENTEKEECCRAVVY
jgi:hypothetical protein